MSGLPEGVRAVTPTYAVAGQLMPETVAAAKAAGVCLLINNRPDDEEPGQPSAAEMAKAAEAAGVAYLHLPVRGMPTPDQVRRQHGAVSQAEGQVLAFCRSGMRSIYTWALGEMFEGGRPRDEVVRLARDAGYDLSAHLPH